MKSTPLDFPETERIAALLAEVTGRSVARPTVVPPPLPDATTAKPIDVTVTQNIRASVRQLLEEANWRNEAPATAEVAVPVPEPKQPPSEPGPLPAPFGVLTVGTLFALINWRNQPDDVRPLPLITPPPPPGSEFTVGAVMTTFGWE
jgi:hypothetical protein